MLSVKAQVSLDALIALIVFIVIIGHVATVYTSMLKSNQDVGYSAMSRYRAISAADYLAAAKILKETGVASSLAIETPEGQVPVYGLVYDLKGGLVGGALSEGSDLLFGEPYYSGVGDCNYETSPRLGWAKFSVKRTGPGGTALGSTEAVETAPVLCTQPVGGSSDCPPAPQVVECGDVLLCEWEETEYSVC